MAGRLGGGIGRVARSRISSCGSSSAPPHTTCPSSGAGCAVMPATPRTNTSIISPSKLHEGRRIPPVSSTPVSTTGLKHSKKKTGSLSSSIYRPTCRSNPTGGRPRHPPYSGARCRDPTEKRPGCPGRPRSKNQLSRSGGGVSSPSPSSTPVIPGMAPSSGTSSASRWSSGVGTS